MIASFEKIRSLQIVSRRRETPETVTLVLVPADDLPFTYQPGQFIDLLFSVNGREKRRSYSLSSSPATDPLPAITVKRVPNGEFSNELFHHAGPGDLLRSTEPGGRFLLPDPMPERLIYVAAGSGITPVMSHLKTLFAGFRPPRIALFYASRDTPNTIFKPQLDAWMHAFPERFECTYIMSREKGLPHETMGHLNNQLLEQLVGRWFGRPLSTRDRSSTHIFLCAPKPVMRMAEMTLRVMDFPAASIQKEIYQPEVQPPPTSPDPSVTHTIIARGNGQRIEFQTFDGETILNAALRQGIALPYSCKTGVCFTCIAKCMKGTVEVRFMDSTRLEGPGKMVNTCIGYAVSAVVELEY